MIRTAVRTTLSNPPAIVYFRMFDGADIRLTMTNNIWRETDSIAKGSFAIEHFDPNTFSCTRLDGNVTDTTPNGYMFLQDLNGIMILDEGSNIGPINETGIVLHQKCNQPIP